MASDRLTFRHLGLLKAPRQDQSKGLHPGQWIAHHLVL